MVWFFQNVVNLKSLQRRFMNLNDAIEIDFLTYYHLHTFGTPSCKPVFLTFTHIWALVHCLLARCGKMHYQLPTHFLVEGLESSFLYQKVITGFAIWFKQYTVDRLVALLVLIYFVGETASVKIHRHRPNSPKIDRQSEKGRKSLSQFLVNKYSE